MKDEKIPAVVIPRLSLYYRTLLESSSSDFISSDEIARLTGLNAAQVRKDLAYFGQFGEPGKGYQIETLKQSIVKILGTDRQWPVILVGVGNLGSALLAYKGFTRQGFKIICAFDSDLRKIGKNLEGVLVKDLSELEAEIKLNKVEIAIVTVPQATALEVIDKLVRTGIRAILNFAPVRPQAPEGVEILNIDLSIELERLAYFLARIVK